MVCALVLSHIRAAMSQAYTRDITPAALAATSPPPPALPPVDEHPAEAPPQQTPSPAPAHQAEPMPEVGDEVEPPIHNCKTHFSMLHLSESAMGRFDSVDPGRFADMVSHAERRLAPFVEWIVAPTDPVAWATFIGATVCMNQLDAADKVLYLWTTCTASESLNPERFARPYKYAPSYDKHDFENTVQQLFGGAPDDHAGSARASSNKSDTSTAPTTLFGRHPSLLMAFDGRRPATTRAMTAALGKMVKNAGAGSNYPSVFRLMHSNAEFHETSHRSYRGDARHTLCPEPLESAVMCFGTGYKVRPTSRKYLDLPGTNRTRGFNNVPLKPPTGVRVAWSKRCSVLAGCSKGLGGDADDIDWIHDDAIPAGQAACGDDEIPTTPLDSEGCDLFPWEHPEILNRELINCFDPKAIIHFQAGSGTWALAAAIAIAEMMLDSAGLLHTLSSAARPSWHTS